VCSSTPATEAGATFPADLPEGPPFFRFADEAEFAGLLRDAGLRDVEVRTITVTHRLSSADEYWDGMVQATVRTGALVFGQLDEVQARIRSVFDRLVRGYEVNGGVEIPISAKVASGRLRAARTRRRATD
jgi:hypothetical protein